MSVQHPTVKMNKVSKCPMQIHLSNITFKTCHSFNFFTTVVKCILATITASTKSTTRNISCKSMHAFLSNLANRQTDKRTRAKTCTSSFVGGNNKKCGRRVRSTRYAPARLQWHRYSSIGGGLTTKKQRWDVHVRRSVNTYSLKTLVRAFVMLRVYYCNAVFAVSLRYITDISMKIRNAQQVFCWPRRLLSVSMYFRTHFQHFVCKSSSN